MLKGMKSYSAQVLRNTTTNRVYLLIVSFGLFSSVNGFAVTTQQPASTRSSTRINLVSTTTRPNGSMKQQFHRTMITMKSTTTNKDGNDKKGIVSIIPTTTSTTVQSRIVSNFLQSISCILKTIPMIVSSKTTQATSTKDTSVLVQEILQICDEYDDLVLINTNDNGDDSTNFQINDIRIEQIQDLLLQQIYSISQSILQSALQYQRYELLVQLMQTNYTSYIATASFLSTKLQRYELPNVQDVPYIERNDNSLNIVVDATEELVPDCTLNQMIYNDTILDKLLLSIFRQLVTKYTGGVTSPQPGILGLLEQGRTYMIQNKDNTEQQHIMVQNTLGDLMTPLLPPFYRIFMSGIIPKISDTFHPNEKQYGPWFYAPFLTSWITPTFFAFLVGPSHPNRHVDGQYGGLLVQKCKFLQESNCKGLCIHQCKVPAQNFFQQTLGMSLNVIPNFITQECQWNFNQLPILPIEDDPAMPKGCISGCTSRPSLLVAVTSSTTALTQQDQPNGSTTTNPTSIEKKSIPLCN